MSKIIRIFIVEDHDMFREGIKYVLGSNPDFEIVGEASNGVEFLAQIDQKLPDVVLMDIDMPIMNGIEATSKAIERYPNLNVITLSMYGDHGHYTKMIDAGAKGFVLKNSGVNQLSDAVKEVASGNVYFSQELLVNIIRNENAKSKSDSMVEGLDISDREMEVLRLICQGLTNKLIAEKLFISIKTVEGHKSKLMLKTETNNTVSLVLFSIKNQLVEI
ncbi:MAG: response regulator transcription factor [Prolixibacteraceae bacterium]|jgi:DNA-binding NarL/FixJ family response regulator|nr:response regulator transcription factor [Prolixibacteraceae bacterium]